MIVYQVLGMSTCALRLSEGGKAEGFENLDEEFVDEIVTVSTNKR